MSDTGSQPAFETLRPVRLGPGMTGASGVATEPRTWWERYSRALSGLSSHTQDVLADDGRYIADQAVPRTPQGAPDDAAFGSDRMRTGIVVGSVQSGKTASMLAAAALLLDQGIDILIVLAGTRVALWLQTYERLLVQLDGSSADTAWQRDRARVLVPSPEDVLSGVERLDPGRYLRGPRRQVAEALRVRRPILYVIPKEDDHLLALGRHLEEMVSTALLDSRAEPIRLVVLDDEADDASILDARDGRRITPEFIQALWASELTRPATRHERLLATYIAYTATPQANYLQQTHNPLAPRSFHAALRTPLDRGDRTPRTTSFTERRGVPGFYCGGDIFYERFRGLPADPCISFEFPTPRAEDSEEVSNARFADVRWRMIGEAMRAYLVAGALRLCAEGRRLSAVPVGPVGRDVLEQTVPAPHTMLYHPSALREDHFQGAADLVRWSVSLPGQEEAAALPLDSSGDPILKLDPVGLRKRVEAEEASWSAWVQAYALSGSALSRLPGGGAGGVPNVPWSELRRTLFDEVFPNVKVRVLNSDPRADDRPGFARTAAPGARGLELAPADVYTIFVAGNVLSRGLTVEGLCISLFMRGSREPAADTQMQMQRWFGYRGRHLAFCRVFLFGDQLALFRQYHQNDSALKTQILNHMDGHKAPFAAGVLVLQGEMHKATAKVDSRRVPLHPGPTPAVRLVEPPSDPLYARNIDVVRQALVDGSWSELSYPEGTVRGLIRDTPLSMLDVATLLERLRYSAHDPDPALEVNQRWAHLQRTLKLDDPLFRPPGVSPGGMAVDPSGCPYSIAAYLRLWSIALQRRDMPGMFPTDRASQPWSFIDLAAYRRDAPRFWLGVRYGSAGEPTAPGLRGRGLRLVDRGHSVEAPHILDVLWGSRNPSERWLGDQVFDYHWHNPGQAPQILTEGSWRRRGQPGLVLFHLVKHGNAEVLAVGLALPHGGPDHIAALRV